MNCCNCRCVQGRECPMRQPAPKTSLDEPNFLRLIRYFRRCGHGHMRSVWLAFDAAFLPFSLPTKGPK